MSAVSSEERGRNAADPGDIPASGWKDVLFRVRRRVVDNSLSITAAGVAFYALIATFPGLLALFAIYGLVFDLNDSTAVSEQLAFLQGQLKPEALNLMVAVARGLAEADRSALGWGIAGGALITLWGTSLSLRALMRALNVAYGEEEKRSLLLRTAVAFMFTVGAVAVAFCIGWVLMSLPVLNHWFHLTPVLRRLVFHARGPRWG